MYTERLMTSKEFEQIDRELEDYAQQEADREYEESYED